MADSVVKIPEPLDIPTGAICLSCNYALRGLPEPRCPECGRVFDPADPWTMNLGRPVGPVGQVILRPARWITRVSYPLAAILTFWSALLPGTHVLLLIVLAAGWAVVLFGALAHGLLKSAVRRIYRQPAPRPNPDRRLLARGRIACLIAAALIGFQVPFRVAFAVSRPFLDRHVRHYYAEVPFDTPLPGPRLCGVLPVRMVHLSPTRVTLSIIGGGYVHYVAADVDGTYTDHSWWGDLQLAPHWHASRPGY